MRSESSVLLDTATSASSFAFNSLCSGDKQGTFIATKWKRNIYSF